MQTKLSDMESQVGHKVPRRRVSLWLGGVQSGKSEVVRVSLEGWCRKGLNVAYVDVTGKQSTENWDHVWQESGECMPLNMGCSLKRGKFWLIHPEIRTSGDYRLPPLLKQQNALAKNIDFSEETFAQRARRRLSERLLTQRAYLQVIDQLIKSRAFDVILLDLGDTKELARKHDVEIDHSSIQRRLKHSNTALLVLQDKPSDTACWNFNLEMKFELGKALKSKGGLSGMPTILPTIGCTIWRKGIPESVTAMVSY